MSDDWSRQEVEATVADYFAMLDSELRGLAYSKTEHRRRLLPLLDGRSDGAVERKHQNVSAALIELGFPYIVGYKPLQNYQQLLFDVVSDRLSAGNQLERLVRVQVEEPASAPSVDDILAALVEPPTPDPTGRRHAGRDVGERRATRPAVDYLALEARNRSLGAAGEEFVMRFEVARLVAAGRESLAAKIEQISITQGEGRGFDVLSFEESGQERFIEVKTTAYGSSTPFFLTRNELLVSHESENYYLYRAFEFRRQPRLFTKPGPVDQSFYLAPCQYVASIV